MASLQLVGARDPDQLRFSFRYLDMTHPSFRVASCEAEYFRLLLARLRELSGVSVAEFRSRTLRSLRIHRIDFADPRVAVRSFGIRGFDADEKGWQFSLSANRHGRVHGFLAENTFYVRWLDPEHNLYPGN